MPLFLAHLRLPKYLLLFKKMSKICFANVQTTKYFPFYYRSFFHWYDICLKHVSVTSTYKYSVMRFRLFVSLIDKLF